MTDNIFAVRLDANELALLGEKTDNIFAVCLDANELAKLAKVDGFIFYGPPGIGKNLFAKESKIVPEETRQPIRGGLS